MPWLRPQPRIKHNILLALVWCILDHRLVKVLAHILRRLTLGALGLEPLCTCHLALLLCQQRSALDSLGVWVELDHGAKVLERVFLQNLAVATRCLGWVDHALQLVAVDQARQVAVGHLVAGQLEALFHCAGRVCGAVDLIQLVECRLGPDAQTAEVTTRRQLL